MGSAFAAYGACAVSLGVLGTIFIPEIVRNAEATEVRREAYHNEASELCVATRNAFDTDEDNLLNPAEIGTMAKRLGYEGALPTSTGLVAELAPHQSYNSDLFDRVTLTMQTQASRFGNPVWNDTHDVPLSTLYEVLGREAPTRSEQTQ